MTSSGDGALPGTAAVVAQVVEGATRAGDRAGGLAGTLRSEVSTLATSLGGGPPDPLREAAATALLAAAALDRAAAGLAEAVTALQAFAGRLT